MKKHSASLQFPTIDGNAGGREAEVGSFDATNGPVVLPGPPLALPEADELVMLPDGKLDAGIDPGAKLMKRALVPAKPPTVLKAPPVASPADEDELMLPKLAPTKPPTMSRVPVPVTEADGAVDDASDGAQVHAGESAEITVAGAGDGAGRDGVDDGAAGQAGKPADDAVGSGAGDRSHGERRQDHASAVLEAQRADEAAQHAVAAAQDVAERGAVGDQAVAGSHESAGDARGTDRDVAERVRVEDGGGVEERRAIAVRAAVAGKGRIGRDQAAGIAAVAGLHVAERGGRQDGA